MDELLLKLKRHNIDIDTIDDQLKLHIPENFHAAEILQEVRANKQQLIAHLNSKKIPFAEPIEHEGELYYAITKFQSYWANEKIDREFKKNDNIHGSINLIYDVIGDFDAAIFRRCVVAIINRHESLRCSFHEVGGRYMMRVEPPGLQQYEPRYRDLRDEAASVDPFIRFDDHRFNLATAPLFAVRIARTRDDQYTVAFKMHHIVGDTYSMRLLLHELLMAYDACLKNRQPQLPALHRQYKDHLAVLNLYYSQNYEAHRKFWKDRFSTLPPDFKIPGANEEPAEANMRICRKAHFLMPASVMQHLPFWAGKTSASYFIILQAAFKKFLCDRTGVADIIIGTAISGRDNESMQYQVGCYAKTVLIRTDFEKTDSFAEVIGKVKRSNEEMKTYQAFTLFDAMHELRPKLYRGSQHFQKVNMQYEDSLDMRDEFGDGLFKDLRFIQLHTNSNSHISIDMQLSFFASPHEMELEVQYDSSLYELSAINDLINDFITHTSHLLRSSSS